MTGPDLALLRSRGWDLSAPADRFCHLDCTEPGYRKTWTDPGGCAWEIILCPADAQVLEEGFENGDYDGALTPAASRAPEWPWIVLETA